jgi:cupin 2 domain-containing protein
MPNMSENIKIGNLFTNADPPLQGERFEELLRHKNLVIERIVSSSSITPVEYTQTQDEWVILLQGRAVLSINDNEVFLSSGDYLFLPAGLPHTVEDVSQGALWLTVHLHASPGESSAGSSPFE